MQEIPFDLSLATTAFRLFLAIVLAGIIGWDRERLRKPAGLRTHVMVGIGSTLVMLVSIFISKYSNGSILDTRIAANVVVGIGFLGAGTILHLRSGVVSGLTTAATLWVVAGIGLASGCGFYSGAVLTTIFAMVVLYSMNWLDDYIEGRLYYSMTIHARITPRLTETSKQILRDHKIGIVRTETQSLTGVDKFIVIHFKPVPAALVKMLALKIEKLSGVKEVVLN